MTEKEREGINELLGEIREEAKRIEESCTMLEQRLLTVQKTLRFCWCHKIPVEGALLNAAATELDNIWNELSDVDGLVREMMVDTAEVEP